MISIPSGSDSVFSLRTFTREVKVVQPYFIVYMYIKHSSFPSLCIGDNQGTVLDYELDVPF